MADDEEIFLAPVLEGERFAGHQIPVEVLPDLLAYRDLVTEVAKTLYKLSNPERPRVPRGFVESFQLRLEEIREGSAMAVLVRDHRGSTRKLPEVEAPDWFDQARDRVGEVVEKQTLPHEFRHLANLFNNFGKRLREDEAIILAKSVIAKAGPRYTPAIRRKLALAGTANYLETTTASGYVTRLDDGPPTRFQLRLGDGRTILAPYQPEMEDSLLEAFRERNWLKIRVSGMGSFNSHGRLERFDEVSSVETPPDLDPDLAARIQELRAIEDGWLDGEGKRLSPEGLDWVQGVLAWLLTDFSLPKPFLYPTPEGGVQAEWTSGAREVSATFDLDTRVVWLHSINVETGNDQGEELNADEQEASLGQFLRSVLLE